MATKGKGRRAPERKAANSPARTDESAVPAYLQNGQFKKSEDNFDQSDIIIPRIVLLQATSPEITEFPGEAKAGEFWHNVADKSISNEFTFIIAAKKKKHILFSPRDDGDNPTVLARSDDGVTWDKPNQTFKVKLDKRTTVEWSTKGNVKESGLADFGSSDPSDPDSVPASVLIHEYLVILPGFPELSPVLLSCSRTQIKHSKQLVSKVKMSPHPEQALRFVAKSFQDSNDHGPFNNIKFSAAGFADEQEFKKANEIAELFRDYKPADEEGLRDEATAPSEGDGAGADEVPY